MMRSFDDLFNNAALLVKANQLGIQTELLNKRYNHDDQVSDREYPLDVANFTPLVAALLGAAALQETLRVTDHSTPPDEDKSTLLNQISDCQRIIDNLLSSNNAIHQLNEVYTFIDAMHPWKFGYISSFTLFGKDRSLSPETVRALFGKLSSSATDQLVQAINTTLFTDLASDLGSLAPLQQPTDCSPLAGGSARRGST